MAITSDNMSGSFDELVLLWLQRASEQASKEASLQRLLVTTSFVPPEPNYQRSICSREWLLGQTIAPLGLLALTRPRGRTKPSVLLFNASIH